MKKEAENYYLKKIQNYNDWKERLKAQRNFNIENIKKIHISGACGKFMASLSSFLKEKGYSITLSDKECNPPMSLVLDKMNLKCLKFDENNLKDIDLFVVGNACSLSNPEVQFAIKHKIPQASGPEIIGKFFIENKKSIVISGTHGKTTTSSLLSCIFGNSNKKTDFLVGGVIEKYQNSYLYNKNKKAEYFIIEGDEYDTAYFDKSPKFLHYKPHILIITSLEFDHADIYKDFDDYKQSFSFLIDEVSDNGKIFIFDEVKDFKNKRKNIFYYGFKKDSDLRIFNTKEKKDKQFFDIDFKGKIFKNIEIPLTGEHNILNSAISFIIAWTEGLNEDWIRKELKNFKGVKKRQEIIYNQDDILIIDDYAHHPTAVKTTLEGLKKRYPSKRMIAVFEPRSNTSRMKTFQKDYVKVFNSADFIIISEPIKKTEGSIDVEKIIRELKEENKKAECFGNPDEIFNFLKKEIKNNDMIVIMSNGDFGFLAEKLKNFFGKN